MASSLGTSVGKILASKAEERNIGLQLYFGGMELMEEICVKDNGGRAEVAAENVIIRAEVGLDSLSGIWNYLELLTVGAKFAVLVVFPQYFGNAVRLWSLQDFELWSFGVSELCREIWLQFAG